MKKAAKLKFKTASPKPKKASKRALAADPLPSMIEGMTKLVERLESLERKMDQVLGRLSVLGQNPRPVPSFQPRSESVPQITEKQLFEAICADCEKRCQVPFKPGSRPVYCKECWAIRKAGHRSRDINQPVQKSSYTPSVLTENAIPSLTKKEMTVFEKSKKKSKVKSKAKKKK